VHEVADINRVGLEQLIERPHRVGAELQWRDRLFLERGEGVGNEALRAQLLIDLPERWLSVVETHELHLSLDDDGVLELLATVHEYGELAALDVDLDKIDAIDLGDVIEAPRLERHAIHNAGIRLEEAEHIEGGCAGHEQTRPAGIGAQIERVLASVAHRVGEIDFVRALPLVQLGKRSSVRLEAGETAELSDYDLGALRCETTSRSAFLIVSPLHTAARVETFMIAVLPQREHRHRTANGETIAAQSQLVSECFIGSTDLAGVFALKFSEPPSNVRACERAHSFFYSLYQDNSSTRNFSM
jgi:hypothetical protein